MISTHVLDTSIGSPAEGITVTLEIQEGSNWKALATGATNADGRHVFNCEKVAGNYRLTFGLEPYFQKTTKEYFFLTAPVIFKITNLNRKYHVPLLLNPYGYSTYRGS